MRESKQLRGRRGSRAPARRHQHPTHAAAQPGPQLPRSQATARQPPLGRTRAGEGAAGRRAAGGRRAPVRARGTAVPGRARLGRGDPAGLRGDARTAGEPEPPPSPLGPPCDFESGAPDRSLETVTPRPSSRGRRRLRHRAASGSGWPLAVRQALGGSRSAPGAGSLAWRLPQCRGGCLR